MTQIPDQRPLLGLLDFPPEWVATRELDWTCRSKSGAEWNKAPRKVSPTQLIRIQTSTTVPQYVTHRLPANFHRPNEFVPEHFLPEDPEYDPSFVNDNRVAFQLFVVGPRNCTGRNLAYVEMRLLVSRLLGGLDPSLATGAEAVDGKAHGDSGDWMDQKVTMFWQKKEL